MEADGELGGSAHQAQVTTGHKVCVWIIQLHPFSVDIDA